MPQHVVAVPRLLGVHEGQGPARRRLHHQPDLRHLRGQPHHLLGVRAEHGLRHHAATAGGEHHQSRRGRRVHVRSHDLPGQPGVRGLLRGHGQADQPERAGPRGEHRGPARRAARLPHDRGHHALVQPVRRRLLPAGVEGVPDHPGDVLPDGGPPRAPVHGLSRRGGHDARTDAVHRLHLAAGRHPGLHQALRRDERRHLRLLLRGTARLRGGRQAAHPARLLGRIPELGRLRLPLRDDERLGQGDVRHAGRRGRRRAGDEQPGRHQPGHPDPAGQLLLRRLGQRAALRHPRPPGQPGRHPPPVEPDDPARTGQAGLRRPLQLGDEPTVAAPGDRGASRAGHRRWPVRPALHHRAVRVARHADT